MSTLSLAWHSTLTSEKVWRTQGWMLSVFIFASFFPPLFRLEEYLFFGCLLFAVLITASKRDWHTLRNPLEVPLALVVGWVLLTIPFSADPTYSFSEWRKLISQVLMFYWALLVFRHQSINDFSDRIIWLIVLGSMIIFAWAFGDYVKRGGSPLPNLDLRATLPFSGPQWLATYVVLTFPFVVLEGLYNKGIWIRICCWLTVVLGVLALFYALQRGAWLAYGGQVVLLAVVLKRTLLPWTIGGGIVIVGMMVSVGFVGSYGDLLNTESIQYRWAVWKLGIEQLLSHPIVGIGYGNDILIRSFSEYKELSNAKHLHNTFLMMGVGSGVIALFALLALFGKIIATLLLVPLTCDTKNSDGRLVVGVLVMVVGFAIRNIFDYMLIGSMACLFWIVVAGGLVAAMYGQRIGNPIARVSGDKEI